MGVAQRRREKGAGMHRLVVGATLLCVLVLGSTAPGLADTCSDAGANSKCGIACTSWDTCLRCCAATTRSVSDCRTECASLLVPHRPRSLPHADRVARPAHRVPTRPTRPTQRSPHRPRPTPRPAETPSAPAHLSASCRSEQQANRVTVTLDIINDSTVTVTGVVPHSPVLQLEAETQFTLRDRPSPSSYPILRAGDAASFSWLGRLSSGAVGISASAAASDPNGASVDTAQVDCGTLGRSVPTPGPDQPSEAAQCGACHSSSAMAFVAGKWLSSGHASTFVVGSDNVTCATCHAPLQAAAARGPSIPETQWQGVTCSACHPPEAQMSEWHTPIATYDVATKTYQAVALWDADVLCTQCHTGEHAPNFEGYGLVMHYAGVRCIDCHMAKIPTDDPTAERRAAHDFKVAANLPYSCGTYPGGCHARRPESWAARILTLGPMHAAPQGQ